MKEKNEQFKKGQKNYQERVREDIDKTAILSGPIKRVHPDKSEVVEHAILSGRFLYFFENETTVVPLQTIYLKNALVSDLRNGENKSTKNKQQK